VVIIDHGPRPAEVINRAAWPIDLAPPRQ